MNTLRFTFTLSAIVGIALANTSWSQQTSSDQSAGLRAANPTTAVLVEVDPNRIAFPEWLNQGNGAVVGKRLVDLIKNAAGGSDFYVAIDVPGSVSQPVVRLLVLATNLAETENAKTELARISINEPVSKNGFVFASPTHRVSKDSFEIDETVIPVDRKRFASAAKHVEKFPIRVMFVPPAHVWETYEELLAELPSKLGGGSTSIITEGMEWAAIGVDLHDTNLDITIQSKNAEAAQTFARRLPDLTKRVIAELPNGFTSTLGSSSIDAIVKLAKIEVTNDQIRVAFSGNTKQSQREILAAIWNETSAPIASTKKRNRMRQILLGVLNYESAYASFPPSKRRRGEDGTSGLSWRVHILPYLEEVELYRRFHLDEPWDSPHNIKLLEQMPDVFNAYANGRLTDPVVKPGHTTFVAPVGEGTILGGKEVRKVRHISDGTSKTLLLVEVKPELAVPWTAPQDYAFSPDDPGAGLAWDANGNVGVGFCDGAWKLLPKSTSKQTLRNLFLMNDGHAINLK